MRGRGTAALKGLIAAAIGDRRALIRPASGPTSRA